MTQSRMLRKIRSFRADVSKLLFGSGGFDSEAFMFQWEKNYGDTHDPNLSEVISRVLMLSDNAVICEIGAGYGRVLSRFPDNFKLIGLEPNKMLYDAMQKTRIHSLNLSAKELPNDLNVNVFFSVRALHYVGVVELYILLSKLKRSYPESTLIIWERKDTCRRIRLVNSFIRFDRCFIQELIN